jgi:hypothetical protein
MLIHPFVPLARATSSRNPVKSAQSPLAERKQIADRKLLYRILLEKPSFSRRIFSPSWAHKSDSLLYQILVLTQVLLPTYMYYSGKIFTYKLDRTTVTVGAPSMLAMSTSPASAGASSSASVAAGSSAAGAAAGSSAAGAAAGSVLLSATGACGSTSFTTGAGLRLLSAGSPTVSQSPSSP